MQLLYLPETIIYTIIFFDYITISEHIEGVLKCVNNETKKSVAVSFMTSEKKDKDRKCESREK